MKFKATKNQLEKLEIICNLLNELWEDCTDNFNGNHFDAKEIATFPYFETELQIILNKWKEEK